MQSAKIVYSSLAPSGYRRYRTLERAGSMVNYVMISAEFRVISLSS